MNLPMKLSRKWENQEIGRIERDFRESTSKIWGLGWRGERKAKYFEPAQINSSRGSIEEWSMD